MTVSELWIYKDISSGPLLGERICRPSGEKGRGGGAAVVAGIVPSVLRVLKASWLANPNDGSWQLANMVAPLPLHARSRLCTVFPSLAIFRGVEKHRAILSTRKMRSVLSAPITTNIVTTIPSRVWYVHTRLYKHMNTCSIYYGKGVARYHTLVCHFYGTKAALATYVKWFRDMARRKRQVDAESNVYSGRKIRMHFSGNEIRGI
ncbi:hypothetical protein BGZ63DRAFT_382969 [Mariannaea sp. PMI_226]|nr:hypothetical protein BGZ63DRAFT_382969 [Mariannaea sp. PMI_226]